MRMTRNAIWRLVAGCLIVAALPAAEAPTMRFERDKAGRWLFAASQGVALDAEQLRRAADVLDAQAGIRGTGRWSVRIRAGKGSQTWDVESVDGTGVAEVKKIRGAWLGRVYRDEGEWVMAVGDGAVLDEQALRAVAAFLARQRLK